MREVIPIETAIPIETRARVRARSRSRSAFNHEKLDVYQLAIELIASTVPIVKQLPRDCEYLADQLRRASFAIPLNIAQEYYARAKASTTECAAVLDVCHRLKLIDSVSWKQQKSVLDRINQMLPK